MKKSRGTTKSERFLADLCENSFLRLWSFPNVYRDQRLGGPDSDGKELCDLLVVCENKVLIFSDKSCELGRTNDLHVDWGRWRRRAIDRSIDQIYGAERWIKEFPDRLFLDQSCSKKFPFRVPNREDMEIYRIVVAGGATERSKAELGGSGSLILCNHAARHRVQRDLPAGECFVAFDERPEKGFVHVFNEIALTVILSELNTFSDFTSYLARKEELFRSRQPILILGEENLLAHYLSTEPDEGQHCFRIEATPKVVVIEDGRWTSLQKNPSFIRMKEAESVSYLWDELIQYVSDHAIQGTLVNKPEIGDVEMGLRAMAMESRFDRRILSQSILHLQEIMPKGMAATRFYCSPTGRGHAYVILMMPDERHNENYRQYRQEYLRDYCIVVGLKNRGLKQIIGIASEHPCKGERTVEICYFPNERWTVDAIRDAQEIQAQRGFMKPENLRRTEIDVNEYPSEDDARNPTYGVFRSSQSQNAKIKVGRNDLCPCKSGRKYKKCCGRKP